MIPGILSGVGIYALVWAVFATLRWPEYLGLTVVLVSIPYGTIGLLGIVGGWLWRRGSRVGGHLAVAWVVVTGALLALEFWANWVPRLIALGDPSTTYNWALPEIWVPVPVALGLVAVVIAGAARLARPSATKAAPNP